MVLFKKIWSVVISFLLIMAVLLIIVFALPHVFGLKPFVITSGSMEPQYPVGSLIYVKNIAPDEIAVGDSITFSMENSKITATHQVYEIDKQNKLFRTQGINNRDENGEIIKDPKPVHYDAMIGKPIWCIPYLGYLNLFCTTKPGYFIIIGAAVAVAIFSFAVDQIQMPTLDKKYKFNEEKT